MELTNCSELGASELVDLRTSGAPQSRSRETLMSDGTLDTELQRWLQWSGSLSSKTDLTLFFCTYTSLTWRTTTHGGTTKVTTTGDGAKI